MSKTTNLNVIILSIIGIVLIIGFGIIMLWTNSFLFRNYFNEYNKYDSIRVGMTKNEVQTIMGVMPGESPANEFKGIRDFDQALYYPIPLRGEPPHTVKVFYKNDRVVSKKAYARETSLFSSKEVSQMRKAKVTSVVRIILIMFVGIVGALAWLVVYPQYKTIREKSGRKFWIDILLGFSFITSLLIVVFFGIGFLVNIFDILLILRHKSVFNIPASLSLILARL
jgi:hypothetical protein